MVPYTIPSSPLSEKDIEKILSDVALEFSPQAIRSVFLVVERYPLEKYFLEVLKIKIPDQLKQLAELVTTAEKFKYCIVNPNPYFMLNPVLTDRAEKLAEEMKHAADEAMERINKAPIKKGRKKSSMPA